MTNEEILRSLSTMPSGKLRYTLMNDYMFKSVLQKNKNALKGLLYALLDLPEGSITSIDILNPIEPGETIDDKTCVLDLKISLNNDTCINLEMQILNSGNWPERSLIYLGRAFDNIRRGEDYSDARPTIHIGILDFNLPHLTPQFYSEFKMMNVVNHEIYSDKFVLRVLNLKSLEDETIKKEPQSLYHWAKLFKAHSWEELKMLSEQNSYIADTVVTYHEMTADEKIREQCEAREKYYWDRASLIRKSKNEGYTEGKSIGIAEGKSIGIAEGKSIGIAEGKELGANENQSKINTLISCLVKDGRLDDLAHVTDEPDCIDRLLAEYRLN